ncbi:MAG: High-affinity branched-chain amino acid transport system permease protein LivH [Alphaproteobacteria bacterium MarineAlpha9_Bin4]|nr:branched-chain amino acid ABC transporter permease [Pelagibacterales bacterium]PPR26996.1 MAG: High-affinity branched-chain amino acid transport system permease protein LivH [Alphaproteobacteria bacterium MarineAlpha9_Bin4]|tara:strand:- start:139 stop:1041 length:903 start_codon:yes stop_codon:yes gene_type:complete
MLDSFPFILLDSLVYASWLFLVASGLTLIYGVMKVLNIAHGSLYAFGAYTTAWLIGWFSSNYESYQTLNFLFIPIAAILVGFILSIFIERLFLRKIYGRDEIVIVLVTYGLFLIFEDTMKILFGTSSYLPFQPRLMLGDIDVFGLPYVIYDLLIICLAVLVWLSFYSVIKLTKIGKLLIAVIHDREIASSMGINVSKFFVYTFFIGCFLGCLGGAVSAPMISVVPGIGVEVIVLAFAVVVTGGLGSISGAAIGAILIGLFRTLAIFYFPQLELFIVFFVMAIILSFKPDGLLGSKEIRKI